MELIIKPTGQCNFNCTFCSSANLDISHPTNGVPDQIKDLILKMKPTNIIITGGEPLTINPEYYLELMDIAKCPIGFTSNMKDFYLHPEKWESIVKNPDFGFITSFNYGDSRRWDENTPYTEEKFIEVTNLFKEVSGRPSLPFIAVIDENNEDKILDHVYLAKKLNTMVKINGATKIGRCGKNYPKYKIIQAYLKIIELELDQYEITCHDRELGRCAFNINFMCNSTIRCCYVDTNGNLHYGICDDEVSAGKEIPMDIEFPVKACSAIPGKDEYINDKCVYCELFRFCHGCNAHRIHTKEFPEHCDEMLKMKDDLIRTGWAL